MSKDFPERKAGYEAKDIGAETILHNEDGDEIHVLNATAALIWELCDGEHTRAEMEKALREEYAIADGMDVSADIERTLAVFRSKNLLANKAG